MKKFDLEAAKAGAPVVTRSGKKARILCFDRESVEYPIVALINGLDVLSFTETGVHSFLNGYTDNDLFMAPQKKEYWVNVYKESFDIVEAGQCHNSEADAIKAKTNDRNYLATVKIYEELV
jgi:hypothetical protein